MKASSHLLATAYITLIYNPGMTIYSRMNLISIMFTLIKASLPKKKAEEEELKNRMDKLERTIKDLKENYENDLERTDYGIEKRSQYEVDLDNSLLEITLISEENDLFDASMIKDVQATRWRD